jgi:hypothetical protein
VGVLAVTTLLMTTKTSRHHELLEAPEVRQQFTLSFSDSFQACSAPTSPAP